MNQFENAEAILYFDRLTEGDGRIQGRGYTNAADQGPGGVINAYDWKVWSGSGFGQQLAQKLSNLSKGYSAEVSDFGRFVVVRASYHSTGTGKSVSKTYVVYFENPRRGDGQVFSTSTKWRSITNPGEAANYIYSSIQSYAGAANQV